jgi:thiamine pyrophosphate-dependent acetolactate synthase large subunit-like protein
VIPRGQRHDGGHPVDHVESLSREQAPTPRFAKAISGNSLIAAALHRCGVKRVIGITGTPVDQIFPECAQLGIRPIGTRHQHTAVVMAATSNYLAGRLESVVVVSAGPAVTNSLTGVLVARDNGWPVIVFGGRRPLHEEGIGYFQELDAVPIYESVTKWAAKVERASDLPATIVRAHETAMSGRPGPVYIDLPEDVLSAVAEDDGSAPSIAPPHRADAQIVATCAQLVRSSDRPLLILGEGVRWSFRETDLRRLVEQNGIPFVTAPLARGFLADDHPLCANDVRRWVQSEADLVLMAGAWFDWRFRFGAELAPTARVIHAEIDSTKLGKNVPEALTVHADSGLFLSQLQEWLQPTASVPTARLESWRRRVSSARDEKRSKRSVGLSNQPTRIEPHAVFDALRRFLPPDAIVVLDGNITLSAGQALLSAQRPCSWLDPGWNGCMGAGIAMAMGAKLASPERMTVVVCGDFGFGLSAMDLETATRHRIPIIVVILNNDGICGALRQKERFPPEYGELFSRFQEGLRYERIAEIFGGHSEFVTEPAEIPAALHRAAAAGGTACVNVRVNPHAPHPGFW